MIDLLPYQQIFNQLVFTTPAFSVQETLKLRCSAPAFIAIGLILTGTRQSNLDYPEDAKEWGVEGNVYVKFVVDSNGDISHADTVEDIDSDVSRFVTEMKENAKKAVMSTSGEWEPAVAHGQEVASWVVLSVSYQIEPNPALPVFIR
jgi:hypothetical protein